MHLSMTVYHSLEGRNAIIVLISEVRIQWLWGERSRDYNPLLWSRSKRAQALHKLPGRTHRFPGLHGALLLQSAELVSCLGF